MDDEDLHLDLLFGHQDQEEAEEEVKTGRLTPIQHLVPAGFTRVADGIYRSGFPDTQHLDIYKELNIKTVCTLTRTKYHSSVKSSLIRKDIAMMQVPIMVNEHVGVRTPYGTIESLFRRLIDPIVHPVVIHCDSGARQAACVVGCFRRLQGWDMGRIIQEYRAYPGSVRGVLSSLDVQFILNYHPSPHLVRLAYVLGFTSQRPPLSCLTREDILLH